MIFHLSLFKHLTNSFAGRACHPIMLPADRQLGFAVDKALAINKAAGANAKSNKHTDDFIRKNFKLLKQRYPASVFEKYPGVDEENKPRWW